MIIFRADGNSRVGLGHVMRCLSIANAFRNAGENCLFVTADSKLCKVIEKRGHENVVLDTQYNHMEDELEIFKQVIDKSHVNVVFVDSYYVTEQYLNNLMQFCSSRCIKLVYLDDVLAFPYPCDVLINYNIYADYKAYNTLYKDRILPHFMLGTKYAPQRAEFQNLADRKVKEEAKDILISTGGADSEHIGLEIVKAIYAHPEWGEHHFHLVVGMMNSDKEKLDSISEEIANITVYNNVEKMAELMKSCDVAISAAGSTLYELCSTQTPTITYILADNQIPGAKGFENAGVLSCAGDLREKGVTALVEKMIKDAVALCDDYFYRNEMAHKMKKVIDGKGAERIAKEVVNYKRGE